MKSDFHPEAAAALQSKDNSPSWEKEPINILLVDDEARNLTALETVLEDPDYRLIRAGSADEALLALVSHEFALLILDIQMPDMNGFELAAMIKSRKKTASVPIIFLTAYFSEEQHVNEGYLTGAVDFLHKPINPIVLRSKVAVFADLHRKTRENVLANQSLVLEIAERRRAQKDLKLLNDELERRVQERTAELSESESRFRTLAEEMPHFVWETDPQGQTTYRNARWQNFSGHSPDASSNWLELVHPEDAGRMEAAWKASLQSGEESEWYCRNRRACDGEYRWFHVKAAAVRNANDEIVKWVGTGTDIHEYRKAQEALKEADRRKDEFLAMLGHELRNPLAAIRHAVRIRQEATDNASQRWASEVIDRQSNQLARMVDDLLDVERINRGRIELRSAPVLLDKILRSAIQAVQPMISEKKHALLEDLNGPLLIQGDSDRLEQIFVNLLTNSVKYTPEKGQILVETRQEGFTAVIRIIDNGVGIPQDLLPHVFDLFTQARTSLDRAQGGLGIGLTVVRTLVEMHGGTVTAEIIPGTPGTTLIVHFPLLSKTSVEDPPLSLPIPTSPAVPNLRVLIVDDHVDAARTMEILLKRRNFEVMVAHDGPSGLIAACEFSPDVLLLDLGLPGFDGFQLARTLQSKAEFSHALFIAISGYAQESDILRSREAGFHHHFAKPVNLNQLTAAMREPRGGAGSP